MLLSKILQSQMEAHLKSAASKVDQGRVDPATITDSLLSVWTGPCVKYLIFQHHTRCSASAISE